MLCSYFTWLTFLEAMNLWIFKAINCEIQCTGLERFSNHICREPWPGCQHPFHNHLSRWQLYVSSFCIQLFRERLSEKNVHATIPKGNMGLDQYTVPDTVAVEPTFVALLQNSHTYFNGLSCHSFKFLWRTVNSKPPTIPFRIGACTFSDNLSQNSCILVHH